ncbi:MAG: ATP-dependent DNA helicase RecG [Candidatus Taylorbacteria bacterium]|nr:ATP-dependent DNA helicase RecG [Candidatus Taylorbacteria bacterium]
MPVNLNTLVADRFRLTPPTRDALRKLGITTIKDLIYHFPVRYGDTVEARNIDSLQKGDAAVIFGKISGLKASKGFKTKITMADGYIEDGTSRIHCVWFNQPYIAKMTPEGASVRIEGKVSERRNSGELYFSNPKLEVVNQLPAGSADSLFNEDSEVHNLYPVYPESRGVSSAWLYHNIQKIFKSGILDELEDPLPGHILVKYHLPNIRTALIWIHAPLKKDDAEAARKRFAFEEIFLIQLARQKARAKYRENPAFMIEPAQKFLDEFIRRFPFQMTSAQTRSIQAILGDFGKGKAMTRLLEGDVGSGKTAVAAAAAFATVTTKPSIMKPDGTHVQQKFGNLQVAYMCPTEILATQQYESFIQYFSYLGIRIGLITSSGCRIFPSKVNPKSWTDIARTQLLSWVENGEVPILIGTHSLIQKSVKFKHLAFVIIDEQHRFGTGQRAKLLKKHLEPELSKLHSEEPNDNHGNAPKEQSSRRAPSGNVLHNGVSRAPVPHLLSMTATPIPRTLALTIYGDLDLTLLDESPAGRKPIITEIVYPSKRDEVYEKIQQELTAGRQMYVICPRIDEPDPEKEAAIIAKSVKEEAKRLKKDVFPEYEIGVLHSKMKPKEKDDIMIEFKEGRINILCSTSVVEVGVNVPNATVIIIEGAERFGLSQLHQLRGRVMRSSHQAYCYCFSETTSEKSAERMKALKTAKNGFELAEFDLAQRGAGELSGARQWGVSDVAMDALQNLKLVEAARNEAIRLISNDAELGAHLGLLRAVQEKDSEMHFE